jgi:BASS family bile acid:Na+ symporter
LGDVLVATGLPIGLAFIMFALGLGLTPADFARVVRRPGAVAIGLAAQLVMIPLVAWTLLQTAELPSALALGVMILAVSPGGVTSNLLAKLADGDVALSITLTGLSSLLSVLTVPPLVALFAARLLGEAGPAVDVAGLGLALAGITALPVGLGLALRRFRPAFARRWEPAATRLAAAVFFAIIVAAVAANWALVVEVLPRLAPLLIGLNLILLAGGLALGALARLDRRARVALALEAGIQNGTLGVAVGSLLVAGAEALPPYSLPSGAYGLTMYPVAFLFVLWARRWVRGAGTQAAA